MSYPDEISPRLDGLYVCPMSSYASYLKFSSSGRVTEAGASESVAEVADG
jgi:hypothetical protein